MEFNFALAALRGLAALMVVVSHTLLMKDDVSLGMFGVTIFFALSGYLNGSILSHGERTTVFWRKRAWRVLPLYLAVVAVVLATDHRSWTRSWHSILTVPDGTSNVPLWSFLCPLTSNLYGPTAANGVHTRLAEWVMWSIAVELWAYLLLPFVVRQQRTLWLLIGISPFCQFVLWAAHTAEISSIDAGFYTSFFTLCRIDAIIWGVLAVTLPETHPRFAAWLRKWWSVLLLGRLLLCWVPGGSLISLYSRLDTLGTIGLLLSITAVEVPQFLKIRGLPWIGQISYSLYLTHPLVFEAAKSQALAQFLVRVHIITSETTRIEIGVLASIVVAAVIYRLYEKPLRNLGRRRSRPGGASALAPAE